MPTPPTDEAGARRRAEIGGSGLRERVASGTIVNTIYLLGMNGLTITQGLLLAALLSTSEYGLWGLITTTFGTLFALAAIGFDDKYIQQDHPDQRAAFEVAFTLQLALCGVFAIVALGSVPLFALLYDEPRIVLPGMLLALVLPLVALQTPIRVYYRRMDFRRQRLLEGVSPVTTFVVTVALGLAGAGFWSFVFGAMTGAVLTAVAAVANSPYRLRLRWERAALREYVSFSWPLLVGSLSAVVMFQVPLTIAARTLGASAVGAITLTLQITQYTRRVDDIVSHALYPAVCAVRDRSDLMFESFSKSNRLALLWGFPFGIGTALFAAQVVPGVLGERWELAVPLVQVAGVSAALQQIGFNWTTYARALGDTRPIAVSAVVGMVAVLATGVPLLLSDGLRGFALGLLAGTLAGLVVRFTYLRRIFPTLHAVRHIAPSVAPTVVAAAGLLLVRAVAPGDASLLRVLVEAAGYAAVVAALSWFTARALLLEAVGHLRRAAARRAGTAPAAT